MLNQNVFIDNQPVEEVIEKYFELFSQPQAENINVSDAFARVTASAIYAKVSDPSYNCAAMDGIAVVSATTNTASELCPVLLAENQYMPINTGGEIKPPFDSVIMIEDVVFTQKGAKLIAGAYPWQHIRTIGETIVQGEMILPKRSKINAVEIGALLAGGVQQVAVYKKLLVGIIPSGKELVQSAEELSGGKLMEYNSKVFAAQLCDWGAEAIIYPIVLDDKKVLVSTLKQAIANCDVVIINAGSSAGTKDYTLQAISELCDVFAHGLAVKPGKPTILASAEKKPIIGIPGYPVSAYLMLEKCVKPLVSMQRDKVNCGFVNATLSQRVVSNLKATELLRVSVGEVNGKLIATPLERGAASIMSLVKCDGIVEIGRELTGLEAGDIVNVRLYKSIESAKNKLIFSGSHDLLLDVVANEIALKSSHVGSMAGLLSLKKGECHIAPTHLLDEAGSYNVSYVKQMLGKDFCIIKGVGRTQGFMLKKDLYHKENAIDILRENIVYANRQRGAGTRLLLDFLLKKEGINSEDIAGYKKEYTTHMAVAAAVKGGAADVGLGIYAAAKALGLEFIPLKEEQYDFAIAKKMLCDKLVQRFIFQLQSKEFAWELKQLGGYTMGDIGEVAYLD